MRKAVRRAVLAAEITKPAGCHTRPNRLLWLGCFSEPRLADNLILVPALAEISGNARFPARWLPPMVCSPLLVLAAGAAHKRLSPEAPAAAPVATVRG